MTHRGAPTKISASGGSTVSRPTDEVSQNPRYLPRQVTRQQRSPLAILDDSFGGQAVHADRQAGAVPRGKALSQQSAAHPGKDVPRPAGRQSGVGARPDVDTPIRGGYARERSLGDQHTP